MSLEEEHRIAIGVVSDGELGRGVLRGASQVLSSILLGRYQSERVN